MVFFSSPPKVQNNYRPPPVQINDEPRHEQSRNNYSTVVGPQNHQQNSSTRQRPISSYDTSQYNTQPKQIPINPSYTHRIPGESYPSDEDPYFDPYEKRQQPPPSSPLRNLNHFQPIRDPLEALYTNSSQGYYQQQQQQQHTPTSINYNTGGIQPFDLGNLINRIQQDYLDNARPYVSSVQFIQTEQNLANIGLITPSTNRKSLSFEIFIYS
jgi:hypothetical protein